MAFLLGILVYLLEIVLFRELFVLLRGNELVIGWMYLVWFVFSGLGSVLFVEWARKRARLKAEFWLVSVPYVVLLGLGLLIALRFSPRLAVGGEIPFWMAFSLLVGVLSLPAMFSGLGFSLFRHWLGSAEGVFAEESLGFGFMAVVVFVALSLGLDLWYLLTLPVVLVFVALAGRYRWWVRVAVLLPAMVGLIVFWDAQWQLPSSAGRLVFRRDSPLGRVEIRSRSGEMALFYNGEFVSDFKSFVFSEMAVHPAGMQLERRRSALVVGDMMRGLAREVRKYHFSEVVVLEMDPVIAELERAFYPWGDVKVRPLADLYRLEGPFDLIVLGLSDPETLARASFLSREFLSALKALLAEDGVLSIPIAGDEDFLSPELRGYSAEVVRTAEAVFKTVRYLPGDPAIVLAGDRDISLDKDFFARRYEALGLRNRFFSPYYWDVLLSPWRVDVQEASVRALAKRQKVSTRLHPRVYEWFLRYSLLRFDRVLYRTYPHLKRVVLLLGALVLFGLPLFSVLRREGYSAVVFSSFVHMGAYLLIIFSLQIVWASFYQDVTLLSGAYMLGFGWGAKRSWPERLYWLVLPVLILMGIALVYWPVHRFLVFLYVFAQAFVQGRYLSGMIKVLFPERVYLWDLVGAGLGAIVVGPMLVGSLGLGSALWVIFSSCLLWAIPLSRRGLRA